MAEIKPHIIKDMRTSGILASLTAAQAIIESNWGRSGLAQKGKNLFGIKGSYNGQSVIMKTKEWVNGKYITIDASFKKYPSWYEGIADHSAMFNRLTRYANLRGCKDYKQACINVKKDGYATAPDYTQTLIRTIEKYRLYEWDREAAGGAPAAGSKPARPLVRLGSRGDHVRTLQTALNTLGGFQLATDGIFGRMTQAAVLTWQEIKGLKVDGLVGPETWRTLGY